MFFLMYNVDINKIFFSALVLLTFNVMSAKDAPKNLYIGVNQAGTEFFGAKLDLPALCLLKNAFKGHPDIAKVEASYSKLTKEELKLLNQFLAHVTHLDIKALKQFDGLMDIPNDKNDLMKNIFAKIKNKSNDNPILKMISSKLCRDGFKFDTQIEKLERDSTGEAYRILNALLDKIKQIKEAAKGKNDYYVSSKSFLLSMFFSVFRPLLAESENNVFKVTLNSREYLIYNAYAAYIMLSAENNDFGCEFEYIPSEKDLNVLLGAENAKKRKEVSNERLERKAFEAKQKTKEELRKRFPDKPVMVNMVGQYQYNKKSKVEFKKVGFNEGNPQGLEKLRENLTKELTNVSRNENVADKARYISDSIKQNRIRLVQHEGFCYSTEHDGETWFCYEIKTDEYDRNYCPIYYPIIINESGTMLHYVDSRPSLSEE